MSSDIIAPAVVALIVGILSFANGRQARENKRLNRRLHIAIIDGLAQCRLEDNYCLALSRLTDKTELALKRAFRLALFEDAGMSISHKCTPRQLEKELELFETR